MKKIFGSVIMAYVSLACYAQETPRIKEAGLIFRGLESFGLTYRHGNTKSVWRFTGLSGNGSKQTQSSDTADIRNSSASFGVGLGKEFRKPITDNLQFRFGADISYTYYKSTRSETGKVSNYAYSSETLSYGPGVNLVLGLNYKVKNLVIGAEALPFYQYTSGKNTERNGTQQTRSNISGSGYGLSNSSVMLSIVYQF